MTISVYCNKKKLMSPPCIKHNMTQFITDAMQAAAAPLFLLFAGMLKTRCENGERYMVECEKQFLKTCKQTKHVQH